MLDPLLTRLVSRRLRPHEQVKAIVGGLVPQRASRIAGINPALSSPDLLQDDRRRLVAVVTNNDSGLEEGRHVYLIIHIRQRVPEYLSLAYFSSGSPNLGSCRQRRPLLLPTTFI